jgi:putative ABC transport system permease protein
MLKLFFKVAWRNLTRNRTYSFINIIGLAIGLACFILISLFVTDELSFDRFNEKADRIYRINTMLRMGGSEVNMAQASDPMGAALKKDYPQIEEFTRIYASSGSRLVRKGNEYIDENRVAYVDSTFFDVFTFPALRGNTHTALNDPNSVVITESTAKKYFGNIDVLGKYVETTENNSTLYKITAVIKDMPTNSHFHYDFLFSMDNAPYNFGNYLSFNHSIYLLLKKGADYRDIEKKFPDFIDRYLLPQAKQVMDIKSMKDFENAGNLLRFSLTPLLNIHLHSGLSYELGTNGNIQYVYIFSAVAIFILLLACVNFVNLSTARSMKRAREVGVRKVLGTTKGNLIRQFISESSMTVLLSSVVAIALVILFLQPFNQLASKSISLSALLEPKILLVLILLPVVVSLVAGSYPAFFLSSFKPVNVLKGKLATGSHKSIVRSSLVVFQFATSIILIIATITVYKQLNFIQNKNIGFNRDQVLVIDGTGTLGHNTDAFKHEVSKLPGVMGSTYSGYLPVSASGRSDNTYSKEAVLTPTNSLNMQAWNVDYDYIPTLGMQMIKGRNFSREFGTDSSALIVNETAASLFGLGPDPIGKKLYTLEPFPSTKVIAMTVIGVVKNFNFESLRQNIGPLCFTLGAANWSTAFRIKAADASNIVHQAESKWKSMSSGTRFSYRFLDDSFNNMYIAEQRMGTLAMIFATLAIVIACLGLFGLATFMAEQRTKEIGVRKVLGASVKNIVVMLSEDFLKLIAIAAVFAFPVAWWSMHTWLQDFAYRINIGWWIFAVAGLTAMLIALFTISFQAIRSALANPVKSLRTE